MNSLSKLSKNLLLLAGLIMIGISASGCASTGATGRKEAANISMPPAGKSRVVFVRPGGMAASITFNVHDGGQLAAVMPYDAYGVYDCEPGHHLFSASMEDVAMLEANLLPDRIYYAKVSAAMGFVIAQVNMYSLYPGCAGNYWAKLPKVLRSLRETKVTPEYIEKDAQGITRYKERIEKYYNEKYLPNPKREQILPEHGQLQPVAAR